MYVYAKMVRVVRFSCLSAGLVGIGLVILSNTLPFVTHTYIYINTQHSHP
jgi:hypothetical protein